MTAICSPLWFEFMTRLQDPSFIAEVRCAFADLLEDRATDPEACQASQRLFDLSEKIRGGEKIPRYPSALGILRGVFFSKDGGMERYKVTHFEVDRLEDIFFVPDP